jgi:hypothetical protein
LFAAPHLALWPPGGDRLAAFAGLADAGADLPLGQRPLVRAGGVAAVGPQLARLDPQVGERVEQRQQVTLLVLVSGREPDRERFAGRLDYEVEATARAAAERARDLLAPFFASTSEQSTITRDQSSLSASSNCCCSTRIACWKAPRADHSSIRRRHVSPLGRPSSR